MRKPFASTFNRLIAAALDFAIIMFVSVFGSFLVYRLVLGNSPELKGCINVQTTHIESSTLARKQENGQFASYTSEEYFDVLDSGQCRIIKVLSYFYTVYLTNDTTKMVDGYVGSSDYNVTEFDVDGAKVLQKDYYTIKWFNENVLELPQEGKEAKNDYFAYQKDGENDDYTKIGTVNPKYVKESTIDGVTTKTVDASKEMKDFAFGKYKEAVNTLYKQSDIVNSNKKIDNTNKLISLIARLAMVLIVTIIIPLCLKGGKTLGKLMFKTALEKPNGEPIARWQVLPRGLFYVLIPVALYFISNTWVQIGIVAGLFVVSLIMMMFTKNHIALHDLIAQTIVVEDDVKSRSAKMMQEAKTVGEEKDASDESVPFEDPEPKEEAPVEEPVEEAAEPEKEPAEEPAEAEEPKEE